VPVERSPHNAKILEARLVRHRLAPGVLGARGREPAAAVIEPAFRAADFAGASRPGDRQSDCLLDLRLGFRGKLAAPVEAERAELFFDLKHPDGVPLDKGGLDPVAGPLQEIPPTLFAIRIAEGRLRHPGPRVEQVRMGLDQFDPPISHRTRHCADLMRARRLAVSIDTGFSNEFSEFDHQVGVKLSALDWIGDGTSPPALDVECRMHMTKNP
jgi:hypothetical protein